MSAYALTIEEGIALVTHYPEAAARNAGFSLLGSRCGDRRVPALWISEREHLNRFISLQPPYSLVNRAKFERENEALCLDQSGSMASSVVYAGVFGAVLASLPAVSTRMVVFDTAVVDLSEKLADPVDVLFGTQLGGGTDINRALSYSEEQGTLEKFRPYALPDAQFLSHVKQRLANKLAATRVRE